MGRFNRESGEIHAKIVYYGPSGSGKTANARFIQRKLKKEHRGDLRVAYARKDKGGAYEFLPVQLGSVRGFQTSIHVHTVPGADPFREQRRRILDGVDGVVFVADLRPDRHEATLASLGELRQHMESYGRTLEDALLVVQYNHRDETKESDLDALHRKLSVKAEASFEAIATEGTGVLQCLTTLSKVILAKLRAEAEAEPAPEQAAPPPAPEAAIETSRPEDTQLFTGALPVAEPAAAAEPAGTLRIESAGSPEMSGEDVVVPIRLVDAAGRMVELSIRVSLS